ncbi:phosphotransferase [Paenibacillus sp. LHD-117]|uniref:phosphotransferase family protein n=1 Tax=Paenibacillus sp. LHD-117 TaxID=3071412 RepID=UPI0027E1E2DB|nr:phosphotransferase [Paenibacillus sp. LHD-117]MDQ6418865.1 phosphotransferase [Paenibacillus sp. LHD-117]
MSNDLEQNQACWHSVVERIAPGGKLLRSRKLEGGVSAEVTALEVLETSGEVLKLVVRRHGEADWRRDPNVARKEFELLELLHSQGMPVPTPYEAGGLGGTEESPYIVVAYVEGSSGMDEPNPNGSARRLAETLVQLHRIDASSLPQGQLASQSDRVAGKLADKPAKLDESLDECLIRHVLEAAWPLVEANHDAILHGDYWPGNTLWRDGAIAAVIDWEDAATGDPLSDVANARLEILWAYGEDASKAFTARYQELMSTLSYVNLPYWDLTAALRPASRLSEWGLDGETERRMWERHKRFVQQALANIGLG